MHPTRGEEGPWWWAGRRSGQPGHHRQDARWLSHVLEDSMHNSEGAVSRPTPRSGDTGTRSSLATLGRLNPEWRPWLDLVDLALERSEEHTSELQSRGHLVCRLLLE